MLVSAATVRTSPPRSTGRISPRPSDPPPAMPIAIIHSGASSIANSIPSAATTISETTATSRGVCVRIRTAKVGSSSAGTKETRFATACIVPALVADQPSERRIVGSHASPA